MSVLSIIEESEKFYDEVNVFHHLSDDPTTIKTTFVLDLVKNGLIAGYAEGVLDEKEWFTLACFINVLHSGRDSPRRTVANWDMIDEEDKRPLRDSLENLFEIARSEGFDNPNFLQALADFDRSNGTDYLIKFQTQLFHFAQLIVKVDGTVGPEEEKKLQRIYELVFKDSVAASAKKSLATSVTRPSESLNDILDELAGLIGMEAIKADVQTLVNYLKVQKVRKERGMLATPLSLHAVFYGPPGTGKTTVARLLGRTYKALGLLEKGHVIETDRAGLVAGYVGQTALKVDEVVNKALDGVLFIDEAYALKPDSGGSDYGQEAIDTLLKRMEDYRDRLAIIVAGYTEEMARFLEANPGVKSRFNRYFYFDDYSPEELTAIFEKFCKGGGFKITLDVRRKVVNILEVLHANRDRTFGNGRLVRNMFEKAVEMQANRIVGVAPITDEILSTLTVDDIPPVTTQ